MLEMYFGKFETQSSIPDKVRPRHRLVADTKTTRAGTAKKIAESWSHPKKQRHEIRHEFLTGGERRLKKRRQMAGMKKQSVFLSPFSRAFWWFPFVDRSHGFRWKTSTKNTGHHHTTRTQSIVPTRPQVLVQGLVPDTGRRFVTTEVFARSTSSF